MAKKKYTLYLPVPLARAPARAHRVPPGQPGLPPVGDAQGAVDPHAQAVAREGGQVVFARPFALDRALPHDAGEAGLQGGVDLLVGGLRGLVDGGDGGPILGRPEGGSRIEPRGHHRPRLAVALAVGAGEAAGSALRVEQAQGGHGKIRGAHEDDSGHWASRNG